MPRFLSQSGCVRGGWPDYWPRVRHETVEFEHGPGRFDAIEPPTNLGILEESWRDHLTPAWISTLPDRIGAAPIAESSALGYCHHPQDLVWSRGIGHRERELVRILGRAKP